MSQEKAQLIAPIGIMTVSGMTATGVITATSFTGSVVGSAKSLVNGSNVSVGVITATSFDGNLTGNILRLADSAPNIVGGVTTATSFVGNLTGSVTDLTSQPAITVGMVTATRLEGPVTGNVTGAVDGDVTGNVTGNVTGAAGGLGVNYNGGWTGAGTSQVRAGVVTATFFHGDGSNLEGVSSGPVSQQAVTIDGAATSIDLSNGNLIYATQSASTTVSFANSENGNVYFVRTKDDNTTARTITWPDRITWNGGTAPTLIQDNPRSSDAQVFLLVTRDMGVTWYGKEVVSFDPQSFSIFSFGINGYGQLGLNNLTTLSSPTQIGTNTNWKTVGTDGWSINEKQFSFGIKTNGTLWGWGRNDHGNLGLGNNIQRSSPTQVGTDTTWRNIGLGQLVGLATKTDGTLWSWGYAGNGQLGLNEAPSKKKSSPCQIPGTTWTRGVGAGGFTTAIKTDGTLWAWGSNSTGVVENSGTPRISSPTQIPGTWNSGEYKVDTSDNGMGGIKADGTLWTWGSNDSGILGQNDGSSNAKKSSPTQVGTDATWDTISFGKNHAGATKTNSTLWVWGLSNESGCLGLNEGGVVRYSSPVQVPGTTWSNVFAGGNQTLATKTDNTLWAWGFNLSGGLGLNQAPAQLESLSSPTQIPGTSWDKVQLTERGAIVTQIDG
jgi:alpha-tubulin suppressor-like RCC1 family protein